MSKQASSPVSANANYPIQILTEVRSRRAKRTGGAGALPLPGASRWAAGDPFGPDLDAARRDPEGHALRSLIREFGWQLLVEGGCDLMQEVFLEVQQHRPDLPVSLVDRYWNHIGGGDRGIWLS